MARPREDRSLLEWQEHGDNLLVRLQGRRILHKKIKSLLDELRDNQKPNNNRQAEALFELNKFKDELGKDWLLWVRRIGQKPKDKKRSKFYVSKKCHSSLQGFAKVSGYGNDLNRCLEELPNLLARLGINKSAETYDLVESVEPFKDAMKNRNKKMQLHDKTEEDFSAVKIVSSITKQLSGCGIHNYEDLINLKPKLKKLLRLEEYKKLSQRY